MTDVVILRNPENIPEISDLYGSFLLHYIAAILRLCGVRT